MKLSLIPVLLASLLLVACSGSPKKEAPVEERGGVATTRPAGTDANAGKPADGASTSAQPAQPTKPGDTAAVQPPQSTASQAGSTASVQTSAVQPPQGVVTQGLESGGMQAAPLASGNSGKSNPLKDPASLLSKRIVLFDFDSSAIREEFRPLIEAHAQYLGENKEAKVILQGHTDERGSREYNLALGQRRAESVRQALSLLGVGDGQIEAVSMGEEKPVAEGHDEAAWQQNRRTELLYQGE